MPFLGGTGRAVTSLFASRGAAAGWSQEKVYRSMVAAGVSYRRTTLLADIRAYWGRTIKEGAARAVRKAYVPSTAVLEAASFKLKKGYQVGVELVGVSRITGETVKKSVYMEYDKLPTAGQIEEESEGLWGEEYQERLSFDIVSKTFTGGYFRA